jgi:membrane protease YdiL (CAAX protease family)
MTTSNHILSGGNMTIKPFEVAATALAGASYYCNWGSGGKISENLFRGVQCFAISNGVDRLAQLIFPTNAKPAEAPFIGGMLHAVVEEIIYAGILQTENYLWMFPRFAFSLITGMRAVKGVVEIPQDAPAPAIDLKIGFLWAIVREVLLQSLPKSYSTPLLIAADSSVFALIEIVPLKSAPLEARRYKALSAFFFRALANIAAQKTGLEASLTQHILFNISRSL